MLLDILFELDFWLWKCCLGWWPCGVFKGSLSWCLHTLCISGVTSFKTLLKVPFAGQQHSASVTEGQAQSSLRQSLAPEVSSAGVLASGSYLFVDLSGLFSGQAQGRFHYSGAYGWSVPGCLPLWWHAWVLTSFLVSWQTLSQSRSSSSVWVTAGSPFILDIILPPLSAALEHLHALGTATFIFKVFFFEITFLLFYFVYVWECICHGILWSEDMLVGFCEINTNLDMSGKRDS